MLRVISDPRCLGHRSPPGYPEVPARLEGVLEKLAVAGWESKSPGTNEIEAPAAQRVVENLHDGSYVERFRRASQRGDGLLDSADNPLSSGTWDATWAAVNCALEGADWVAAETGDKAFVAVRPPGHHAERAVAMGFCYLNTVALAAQHLIDHHGVERLAIVDFDVHHGNGTQHLFEERGDVFFASLHQYPFYPGTGAQTERGRDEGRDATLNIALEAGCGDQQYEEAFRQQVLPALDRFGPQVLLVSAGFDAWRDDPLGGMQVSRQAFGAWGKWLAEIADRHCQGRLLSLLEGGYDLASLGDLTVAYLAGLEGRETGSGVDSGAAQKNRI